MKRRRKLFSTRTWEPRFAREFDRGLERAMQTIDPAELEGGPTEDSIRESSDKDSVFLPHSSYEHFKELDRILAEQKAAAASLAKTSVSDD